MKRKLDISGPRLCNAIKYGKFNRVKMLVKAGADINYMDVNHCDVLSECVFQTNTKYLKYFLKLGIKLNKQDCTGNTAVNRAAEADNKEAVELLIKAGADLTIVNEYNTDFLWHTLSYRYDGSWITTEKYQRMILKNNPKLIKRFDELSLAMHPKIQKEFSHLYVVDELGLI